MQEHWMNREAEMSRNLILIYIPSNQQKVKLSLSTPWRLIGEVEV
jgi:hypothetical protein